MPFALHQVVDPETGCFIIGHCSQRELTSDGISQSAFTTCSVRAKTHRGRKRKGCVKMALAYLPNWATLGEAGAWLKQETKSPC